MIIMSGFMTSVCLFFFVNTYFVKRKTLHGTRPDFGEVP
jgi:hypothetical protein